MPRHRAGRQAPLARYRRIFARAPHTAIEHQRRGGGAAVVVRPVAVGQLTGLQPLPGALGQRLRHRRRHPGQQRSRVGRREARGTVPLVDGHVQRRTRQQLAQRGHPAVRRVTGVRQAGGAQRLAQFTDARQVPLPDPEGRPALGRVQGVRARLRVDGVDQGLHQGESAGRGPSLTHACDVTASARPWGNRYLLEAFAGNGPCSWVTR
ncbi:hypothetical protein GCM10020295_50350 [Streptomyces cinereospinus]